MNKQVAKTQKKQQVKNTLQIRTSNNNSTIATQNEISMNENSPTFTG